MRICIAQPNRQTASETFLQAHAQQLPGEVTVIHGSRPSAGGLLWLRGHLDRAGIRAVRVVQRRPRSWELSQRYLSALRGANPDVVLAEYGPTGVLVMDACRQLNLPLVVHFHGFDASDRSTLELHRESYRQLFQQAAGIIAVSRQMQQRLVAMGAPQEKVHYNPCGVSCEQFAGADPAAAPPVFTAVGRFVEKKAPHLTLIAFAEVHRHHPQARLRMIGDGPLLDFCRQLVAHLRLEQAVTFLGSQPHPVVRREMQAARAFVQHSVVAAGGDCEGTPVSVMEAGAAGLPVVSTRHAGIPDVVIDGQTGLLVNEHNVFGMAAHIRRLVAEPELARRLGDAARARVAEHFSMRHSIGRLWRVVQSCAAGRASGGAARRHNAAA